jgi:Protein of unknown function (DUF3987)/BT4734-like, N-terminal domain
MSKIHLSWVDNAGSVETHDCAATKVLEVVRTGGKELRGKVEAVRQAMQTELAQHGDYKRAKQIASELKKQLPAVMWSGRFTSREQPTNEKLINHSGLLCADLDDLGPQLSHVREKLLKSPHLWAVFRSPSGGGLKPVFRVPADGSKHLPSFVAVENHVRELTGIQIDQACKDVARLCFLSYDPEIYVNEDAFEITPLAELEKPKSVMPNGVANLSQRQHIARERLGDIDWHSETKGFVTCPGKHLHSTADSERDCEINLDGAPTLFCFHNSCRGIIDAINHELRSRIAKAEHQVTRRADPRTSTQWQDPLPLPADMPAVPPFDFASLPHPLRPWIQDISERMQCPPDFAGVAAMVEIGSVIGRKLGIRPKRRDDWVEIPNLWGFVVGRPGLLKTPALQQARVPLGRLIAEALKEYETALGDYEITEMLKSSRRKLTEQKIAGLLKKGDEEAARIEAAAHLDNESGRPICRRYEVNDSTIEKLGELLAENPNGVLLYRDELSGFLRSLDREDRAGDRAKYLEMWDGKGELTYDRIGRGTVRIPSNTLSILGGIQPHILMAYVSEAVRGCGGDGLLQRFQLAVWPDVSKQWRNIDRWPDIEAKNEAFELFKYLDSLGPETVGADASEGIPFLRFGADAQECFDAWRTALENKLRSDSEHPAFESHLAKYRKLVPALALLIHVAGRDVGSVSLVALEKALLWANYLEAHARRIYSAVLRADSVAARELAKHLQRGDLPVRFTLREIYRKGWAGLNTKEDAEAAAEILCDLCWIRVADVRGRQPRAPGRGVSLTFEINPKILKSAPEPTDKTDTIGSVSSVSDQLAGSESFDEGNEPAPVVAGAVDL